MGFAGLLVVLAAGVGAGAGVAESPPIGEPTTDAAVTTPLDTTTSTDATTTAVVPTATAPDTTAAPPETTVAAPETTAAVTTAAAAPEPAPPTTTAAPATTASTPPPTTPAPPETTAAPKAAPKPRVHSLRQAPTRRARPQDVRRVVHAATLASAPPPARGRCLALGAVWLVRPSGASRVLGPVLRSARTGLAATGRVAFPGDGSLFEASGIDLRTSGCRGSGRGVITSLSLLGGAVTARSVEIRVRGGRSVGDGRVAGLEIGSGVARSRAVLAPTSAGLSVVLERPFRGLPAGTRIVVGFALAPRPPAQRGKPGDRPLTVTPPLGLSGYVFPVVGNAAYGDSYGGFRGDVPGNWHHGDDIFARLGTPVVAVASGTLNRVGWEKVGGWRLWVRDSLGNEFYYAHLAAYSRAALRSNLVTAGEVIGFIGNTGDAFTTLPHLHFEIHPRSLLRLKYGGAVDPTGYLGRWRHLETVRSPRPAHPRFPRGLPRGEARYVWRQLLAARGLVRHRAPPPTGVQPAAAPRSAPIAAAPSGTRALAMPARAASPIRLPKRAGGFPDAALAALLLLPALFLVPAVLALREPERLQGLLGRYAARARA